MMQKKEDKEKEKLLMLINYMNDKKLMKIYVLGQPT